MTKFETARQLYRIKKTKLPNVIGLDRPLTEKEFIQRYTRFFSKNELTRLLIEEQKKLYNN